MNIYERKEYGKYIITFNTFKDYTYKGGYEYEVLLQEYHEQGNYLTVIDSRHYKRFGMAWKKFSALKEQYKLSA
jgi:hypothetical protein